MYHEPSKSFTAHIGHYTIHKSPAVALSRFTRGGNQCKHYCTRVRFVFFEKSEPLEHPIVLYNIVSNARPQIGSKIIAIILKDASDQVECGIFPRLAQGGFSARSPFDLH
jgi:hypothetical protein